VSGRKIRIGKQQTISNSPLSPTHRSLPPSALDDMDDSDEDSDDGFGGGDDRDDERSGTRYNYSWFHVIFVMATMYTAMLLTNW
jgi:hypothetical protein